MNFRKVIPLCLTALAAFASAAGAAMTARHSHTSTLLPDGNFLIIGGVTNSANAVTDVVEMYNMTTNAYETWAGGLSVARSSHTATLMSDGRVLVAGGFDASGTPMSSLEICDPIAKTCSSGGLPALSVARGGHTSTLLSNGPYSGQVLICGGQSAAAATSITGSCDRFNPDGNTISAAGAMPSARMGHTAVLLRGGKVFVSGGRRRDAGNTVWIYEPMNELYDPNADSWSPVSALLQGRIDHTATVLNNGIVMIDGGFNGVHTFKCEAEVGEDCWTDADLLAWGYPRDNQDMGSHGYLDGAEYFDQNGGRTVIAESTFGTTPYRVSKHSAELLPDGTWNMFGGYGNIVRTVFEASPSLEEDSVIYLSKTGAHTGTIINSPAQTRIRFPIKTQLARYVSGRLVDADAFFSQPLTSDPSIALNGSAVYLEHSTATLDGYYVGGGMFPGLFDSIMQLTDPAGTVVFDESTQSTDPTTDGTLVVITSTLTFPTIYPTNSQSANSPQPVTGSIMARVSLTLPKIYQAGIKGTADVQGGVVRNPTIYDLNIESAGNSAVDVFYPTSCGDTTCVFVTTINFTLNGTLANLTPDTTIYSPLEAAGNPATLSYILTYTADEIHTLDTDPTFNYGRSDIVVREMVYSTQLGFKPASNQWKDLSDPIISPTLPTPVFNHTTLLTPAADSVVAGGRNCEASPAADCLRGTKTFSPTAANSVMIPVKDTWDAGKKLNVKRAFHTSTMLRDGSILTCGGTNGTSMLSSCELMDPSTKAWTLVASMNYARTRHTATLLPNGNVLVAGGSTPSSAAVSTAEIYYPATNRWVLTSPMAQPRQSHTATLLPDGNVLVAGGSTLSTYTTTTEIYISSTAYWLNSGPMTTPRSQHTATLLKSGNVLMAGGVNGYGAVGATEEFSSFTRAFVPAKSNTLNTARFQHTATLLRDGRVLLAGGSNNYVSELTGELYDGSSWTDMDPLGNPLIMTYGRAGHKALLLPTGKVMITGGETAGAAQSVAESFDPDFPNWSSQGTATNRAHHTSLLTKDNYIINIGGWDGSQYLDTTDISDFSFTPDMEGLSAEVQRQPIISTGTQYFDRGDNVTVQSDYANLHGVTEASGGAAGPGNSSHSNPRIYLQQIDNPSGFLIDLSTRIYSHYGGLYGAAGLDWETTLSSITVVAPAIAGDMPHGWYNLRVAANGTYSNGYTVQVTVPRPAGHTTVPAGNVLGTSSITWTWNQNTISAADSYVIYAASNSVFLTTVAFSAAASYTQAGLQANTAASIMVAGVNLGGDGPLTHSATYYTLAAAPASLVITTASFETVGLHWSPNGNSDSTIYEVSMSPDNFVDPLAITVPVPFSVGHTSTATVIDSLSPNQVYYFRVRAANGAGVSTAYSNIASTITVGNVSNLTGTAISSASISWSWDESTGASFYELYDVTAGTDSAVYVGSTTLNYYTQGGLSANRSYAVGVNAAKTTVYGPVRGPSSASPHVYTLTVQPLPGTPNVFSQVSTGSINVNWITNGNSTWTVYAVRLSTASTFVSYSSKTSYGNSVSFGGLTPNTSYYARLYASNGDGIMGTALDLGYKYTLARAPLNVTPTEISMSGVSLGWDTNGNSSTTIFEVRGSTDNFATSITTYVPFTAAYMGDSFSLSGLLTATTYYFDVAARNGEGMTTARIRAVPDALTLAGPAGAPSGSVGGTSDPSETVTISGTLPTGRAVSMAIPAGSFPSATSIAISSSSQNPCSYLVGGNPITVEVFSGGAAQPQVPVTLTLNYTGAESAAAIDTNRLRMVLARYNPLSGQCLPLETVIDPGTRTIKATLNHFSLFQLMVRAASSNLSDVTVYPNPFYTNRGQGFVTIANMPASAKVRIYTLSGEKVWEGTAGTTGILIWKGVNKSGYLVASGIYMAVIDSSAGKKVLKLAVER